MKFDIYKYIIICDNATKNVEKRIKDFSLRWWIIENSSKIVYFVGTKERYTTNWIRDTLVSDEPLASCVVFQIFTEGSVSAIGNYTAEKTWEWLKNMCSNDIKTIKNNIKDEETGLIPGSAINNKNKSDGLYL